MIARQPGTRETNPSDTGPLIDAVAEYLSDRHTFASLDDAFLIAVWIIHAWLIDGFDKTAYLAILSHEPDCGKTELAQAIRALCPAAAIIYPTLAGITRYFRNGNKTLIIDQIHNLAKSRKFDAEDFNAYLANGHARGGGMAALAGPDDTIEYRDTFGPKIFAGLTSWKIGDEIETRAIRIMAQPGTLDDSRERERRQQARPRAATVSGLRARLVSLAGSPDAAAACERARGRQTLELNDTRVLINRDCDNWNALAAIADTGGDSYGKRMRDIAGRYTDTDTRTAGPVMTDADRLDMALLDLMRNGRLPVDNYRAPGKSPFALFKPEQRVSFIVAENELGWISAGQRVKGRDILPGGSLLINLGKREAELKFKPADFARVCDAIGVSKREARKTYKNAGRLTHLKTSGKHAGDDSSLSQYHAAPQSTLTAIDWTPVIFGINYGSVHPAARAAARIFAAETEKEIWDA